MKQRSLMSGNERSGPLRLFAVKLGRASQPTFNDLSAISLSLSRFTCRALPAIMKAIDCYGCGVVMIVVEPLPEAAALSA